MNEMTLAQRDRLMSDLRLAVADAEELLRLTAGQTGEGAAEIRSRAEALLAKAKANLLQLQDAAVAKVKAAGHVADDYVHRHPWRSIGAALGVGLVLGLLVGRR